jgi:8-oxo-dGTP pyrophosphatase MutT (NUDIX family)
MLKRLKERLPDLEKHPISEQDYQAEALGAAVLAAFTLNESEPELILTQRSKIMRSHAGEVAFPGGKIERSDSTLLDTALRETHEEIGLHPEHVDVIGQIDAMHSRQGVKVQPLVGLVDASLEFEPKTEELDSVFKVPVSLFYEPSAKITHSFEMNNSLVEMPAFKFQDYTIWGLTAAMIVKILNEVNDEQIEQPQIRFKALS